MFKNICICLGLLTPLFFFSGCDWLKTIQQHDDLLKTLQAKEEENESNYQQLKITVDDLTLAHESLKNDYQDLYNQYHSQSLELASLKEFVAATAPLYKKAAGEQLTVTRLLESKPEKQGLRPYAALLEESGKKFKKIAYFFTSRQEADKQYKVVFTYDTKSAKWLEGAREEVANDSVKLSTFSLDTQNKYLALKDDFYSLSFDYNKDNKPDTILVNVPPVGYRLFDGTKKMHEFVENLNEMKIYLAVVDASNKSLLFNKLIEENIDYAFNQSKGISPKGIFPVTVRNKPYFIVFFQNRPTDDGGKYFFRIYEPGFFRVVYSSEAEDNYYCYNEIITPLSRDVDGDKENELILFSTLKESDAKFTVLKLGVKGKK